ncbi:hypothetical protein [Salinarimonas soli]|uniref:Uncharacterized protein n=1 Tax=Salinarimonas soli TaxID=1638099 RepID=A0A5B2VAN3_9HYPH|nr:hypothetical protein [Salinarimonas soli]KAA2235419.1 hypothetical protein F0L46_19510 [Salinarimonas soli]
MSTFSSAFPDSMDDKRAAVLEAIARIEDGGPADLQGLREDLVVITSLIRRNPGIEAATEDLYEAAAAVHATGSDDADGARRLRLLREAAARWTERLGQAQPPDAAPEG